MPKKDHKQSKRAPWDRTGTQSTLSAMSRVLAVLVLMILPGLAGALLDRAFGTLMWTVVGFLLGVCFAVVGMLYVVKVAEFENRQDQLRQENAKVDGDRNADEDADA